MIEESLYQEYNQWKESHKEVISFLYENDSLLLVRFDYILEVLDYLFDKLIDDPTYSESEHEIFVTGFLYMKDQFVILSELLKDIFKNDLSRLNEQATNINFLLNVIDLENDLLDDEKINEEDILELKELATEVQTKMNQNQNLTDEDYDYLDNISEKLTKKAANYTSIHEVFLEIANFLELI